MAKKEEGTEFRCSQNGTLNPRKTQLLFSSRHFVQLQATFPRKIGGRQAFFSFPFLKGDLMTQRTEGGWLPHDEFVRKGC